METERDPRPFFPGVKRVELMHAVYGVVEGRRCGECAELTRTNRDCAGTWFKCGRYGDTAGPGTDWRKKWVACGLFRELGRST